MERPTKKLKKKKQADRQTIPVPRSLLQVPASRVLTVILHLATDGGATDVELTPTPYGARVKYRRDGLLRTSLELPPHIHSALTTRLKSLAGLTHLSRVPQVGHFQERIGGRSFDIGVFTSVLPEGERVNLRVDDPSATSSFAALGYSPEHAEMLSQEMAKPSGLLLVTGPIGSGTSATLSLLLNQSHHEAGDARITPGLLRHDADARMIEEIRDRASADLAMHAALTGRLMVSRSHAPDAFGVIRRLLDLGADAHMLAATLNAVIAQRLVRTICPRCKVEDASTSGGEVFYRGAGCARCGNSGYAGRTVAAEVFRVTPEARRVIERGWTPEAAWAEAERQGMTALRQDLLAKARRGLTTLEEVERLS